MMKKFAIGVLIAAVLFVVIPVGLIALSFTGKLPIPDGYEVVSGVSTIKDGFVACYLLDAGKGKVVLVDAGNDPKATAIRRALEQRGLGPDAVKMILLTHGHRDHLAGCAAFPHATVAVLGPDVALAEGRAGGHGPLTRLFPVKPTGIKAGRILTDGETVEVGNLAVKVFAIPGHTAGSAAYLARGVLFLGDAADAKSNGTLTGVKWMFSDDPAEATASLKALAGRIDPQAVKAMVFGHSGPLAGAGPLLAFAQR